jgi:predicted DNA-binding protein (UPF0251 family)
MARRKPSASQQTEEAVKLLEAAKSSAIAALEYSKGLAHWLTNYAKEPPLEWAKLASDPPSDKTTALCKTIDGLPPMTVAARAAFQAVEDQIRCVADGCCAHAEAIETVEDFAKTLKFWNAFDQKSREEHGDARHVGALLALTLTTDFRRLPSEMSTFRRIASMDVGPILNRIQNEFVRARRDATATDSAGRVSQSDRPRRRPRKRPAETVSELTPPQLEAIRLHGECEGNMAEVGRRMQINRKTAQQHFEAGMAKLGKNAVRGKKPKTQSIPKDPRGQELLAEDDDQRG